MGYKYYYRGGKLSIRKESYKRNIRVERRFGEEYSMDNIRHIIFDINPWKREERVNLLQQFQQGNLLIMDMLKSI